MKRTILGGMAIAALTTVTTFGCQSAEERQGQELRQALRQDIDEIEALKRQKIALMRERMEVVDAVIQSFKTLYDSGIKDAKEIMDLAVRFATRKARSKRAIESAEERLPKKLTGLRQDVEECTDAELPMLYYGVRWEKTNAEGAVAGQKEGLEWDQMEKRSIEDPTVPAPRPSSTVLLEPSSPPPPPAWPLEEIRKGLSKRIDEIEQIHQQIHQMVIAELQAIQPQIVKPVQRPPPRRQEVVIFRGRLSRARGLELGRLERDIASAMRKAKGQLTQAREKL